MPGLRSLVARRRCSLPSAPISSVPVICTYPSVPGTISSRKGHSLDEVIKNDSIPGKIDNVPPDEKLLEKFQPPPKHENGCLPEKSDEETKTSSEEYFHSNIINTLNSFAYEKENYNGINHDGNHSELAESTVEQHMNSQPLQSKEIDYECNFNQVSESISPERIIIKMKLLHGSSLSDVTNITSESSSDCSETLNSDYNNKDSKRPVTHWTIDSILNKPVNDEDINIYANNDNEMCIENESLKTLENTEKHTNNNENISIIESESSFKIKVSKNLFLTELNNSAEVNDKNLILKLTATPEKNLVSLPQNLETLQSEPTRRPSNSSENSEDSICSESSIMSSDSSLKSCSIVIKRLENSNTYSCFRSPRSKRKRGQVVNKTESCQQEKQKCVLYGYNMPLNCKNSNILPCSVTLCDIFSNYPFPKEICPSCSQYYDIQSDMYVDICSNTLTLRCCNCKWLVVKRLQLREIDIIGLQSQNCGNV